MVRARHERRLCAIAATARRFLRDHRTLFRRGRGTESAAVLISDDSYSVGHHHRRRRASDARARFRVVAGLRDRHGAGVHGARHRRGAGRANLGAWLQNPWVLGAFGVLLTIFALTLIAGLDIALPQRWQDGVSQVSRGRSGGKFAAVAVMGAFSALVVGACMTAPLFAVLAFIAHTGNALLGGAALFSMGLGLGVPLLIIGLGAGTFLPRAGAWMDGVKVFFGVVLLAAALWIVWPVLGAVATCC